MSYEACQHRTKRYYACHDTCKDHADEKAEEKARNEKIQKAKRAEMQNRNYIREHYWKERKNR